MPQLSTVGQAARAVGDRSGRTLLVARGRIRARPPMAREHVLDITDEGAPVPLFTGWFEIDRAPELLAALHADVVRRGSTELKRYWWTRDSGDLCFWDTDGLVWRVADQVQRLRPPQTWPVEEVAGVEAYVSEDWVEQGVRLVTRKGDTVVFAAWMNTSARDNPEYDGLALDWDTSWCRQVAQQLAERLDVPFHNGT